MKFVHENFIYHFDIKIENILLNNDYNPLIADFGLAAELKTQKEISKALKEKRN